MKERTVTEWFEEIDEGLKFRQVFGKEETWRTNEQAFYGEKANTGGGPNLFLSTGDALLSALTVPKPMISVTPNQERYAAFAPVVEAIDNQLMNALHVPEVVEDAAIHAFLWGRGIVKVGFDSLYGYGKDVDPEGLGSTRTQYDRSGKFRLEGGGRPGMPWVSASLPHDVVVPWGTKDLRNCPWISHRIVRHIDSVRADKKYSNTKSLQPTISMSGFVESYHTTLDDHATSGVMSRYENKDKVQFVELWENHDFYTRKVYVTATGSQAFHRRKPDALQLDGLPFVGMSFIPRARNFWVPSDAFQLRQCQAELDDISLQASAQRRVSILKGIVDADALEEEDLARLLSPEMAAVVRVKANGRSLKEIFQTIGGGNAMNAVLYQDAEYVRRNARELVGFSRNQVGEFQGARTTATEVETVGKASDNRMGRRQNIIRRLYLDIFRKINQTIFAFWRRPMVIKVIGESGAESWVRFTGDMLAGDYALSLEFSSEIVQTQNDRGREALQLYQMIGQDPSVNRQALADLIIASFNDSRITALFRKGVPPNANVPV